MVKAGASTVVRLRLSAAALPHPLKDVDAVVARGHHEADVFYAGVHPPKASEDERRVQRQAFAGMMWSKQNYLFDVNLWLKGDDRRSPPPESRQRLQQWRGQKFGLGGAV